MAFLEGAYEQAGLRLASIDMRIDALDRKIDSRFDALDDKMIRRFLWTIGIVLSTWLTTIVTILFHL